MLYYKVGDLKNTNPAKLINQMSNLLQNKNDDDIVVIRIVSVSSDTNDLVPKITYESISTND